MAYINTTIEINIPNDIDIELPESSKKEVIEELKKATIENLSKDTEISLMQLKKQASIFLSSIKTLDKDYTSFTKATLNKIIKSQPEASLYLNKTQMAKERVYTQSLYMLAFRFDEFLSRFRKEDERKVLYVFENANGKLESYEMSYKELVVNADKKGRINNISKKRLTYNNRTSIESQGIVSNNRIEGAQIAYNAVKNRLDRYFESYSGQKQNGILMWKEGKKWVLGNVLNTGDLKEAYTAFLFSEHDNNLSKVAENNPGNPKYYNHKMVSEFYNNYINKVTNRPAIVEEDVVTTNKQYGIKGKKASLPSLQQYVDIASIVLRGEINEKNIEQVIKNNFNQNSARNISVSVENNFRELEKMTSKQLKELFEASKT